MNSHKPGYYARLICDHLKALPDFYADNPSHVQDALGLSDEAFKTGVDWCVKRGIIVMEHAKVSPFSSHEDSAMKEIGSRISSMLRTPVLAEAS
ncbi:MAG: hypothetical protein R3E39_13285 [Anaerolineae bacterium]